MKKYHPNNIFIMKKTISALILMLMCVASLKAKTLVVYYSYTNSIETIVNDLRTQIDCDVVEIEPAEKGLQYEADNYKIGSALISAIRNNPDDASSYPAIDPVDVDLDQYDTVIIGAPLWWSQMAAPLQTYLFHNGAKMAGKDIGLIVSSHSSGISGVEDDLRRLVPEGRFLSPSLWIRTSQTSDCHDMIAAWLSEINYDAISGIGNISEEFDETPTFYTLSGMPIKGSYKGICIVTTSKTTRKVLMNRNSH